MLTATDFPNVDDVRLFSTGEIIRKLLKRYYMADTDSPVITGRILRIRIKMYIRQNGRYGTRREIAWTYL